MTRARQAAVRTATTAVAAFDGRVMATLAALLAATLAFAVGTRHHYTDSVAGPFRIVPDHVERCPHDEAGAINYTWRFVRDRHAQDLWYYWINVTSPLVLNDDWNAEFNFASWSSRGGWKDNAYILRIPTVCKFVPTHVPTLWKKIMVATFDDPNRRCPIPAGFYEINNITTDFSVEFLPAFYYGSWRITGKAIHARSKRTGLCTVLYGKTVPL